MRVSNEKSIENRVRFLTELYTKATQGTPIRTFTDMVKDYRLPKNTPPIARELGLFTYRKGNIWDSFRWTSDPPDNDMAADLFRLEQLKRQDKKELPTSSGECHPIPTKEIVSIPLFFVYGITSKEPIGIAGDPQTLATIKKLIDNNQLFQIQPF